MSSETTNTERHARVESANEGGTYTRRDRKSGKGVDQTIQRRTVQEDKGYAGVDANVITRGSDLRAESK